MRRLITVSRPIVTSGRGKERELSEQQEVFIKSRRFQNETRSAIIGKRRRGETGST